MIKEKLIKKLQKLPDGVEICLVDIDKNIDSDYDEGASDGIYTDFEIEMCPDENKHEDSKPFAMLYRKYEVEEEFD